MATRVLAMAVMPSSSAMNHVRPPDVPHFPKFLALRRRLLSTGVAVLETCARQAGLILRIGHGHCVIKEAFHESGHT
jgi:hypothetical protein